MKVIVGLGNVGDRYRENRHNVGFIFLDAFVHYLEKEEGMKINWAEDTNFEAFTAKVRHKGKELLLVKPLTLMNNSGESVSKVINFFKVPLEDLIVIYDDIDLPLGEIRVRKKGSAGTHNGMRSVIQHLGKITFPRIRIGIESRGVTAPKLQDLTSFVLTNFTSKEQKIMKNVFTEAIEELKNLYK